MPRPDTAIRDDLLTRITLTRNIRTKLLTVTGRGRTFNFAEGHKIHEGFLLSAWTAWESMIRELFIADLATDSNGVLRKEIKASGFRLKRSPDRLAELLADHPDEHRFVDWNKFDAVKQRADALLGSGHRYSLANSCTQALIQISKSRNAIAHKSDVAHSKFIAMVKNTPFSLASNQMRGITVGRFMAAHRVGQKFVMDHFLDELDSAAKQLVP